MHWDYEVSKPVEDFSKTGAIKLSEDYDPKKFVDLVPAKDTSGREMPLWKRQLMARQMAEKVMKEDEERKKIEAEEAKYRDMPLWKRNIIEKKEMEAKARENNNQETNGSDETNLQPSNVAKLNSPNHKNGTVNDNMQNMELDEDGLPLAPWQLEMRNKKQIKPQEG